MAHYLVCRVGDDLVAYGGVWLMVDEAHVTSFAVMPEWRRHGIGGRLMLELMDAVRRPGCARGHAGGPAEQRGGAAAVPAIRLPARGRPAALLLRQRRGRAHHDHRPARLRADAPAYGGHDGALWTATGRAPRPAVPARDRAAAGHRELLRRDVGRGRRGRPAHPCQRRGEPDGAPRADRGHRARGRRTRPPALDDPGARGGVRPRRCDRPARPRRHRGDRGAGPRRVAAGGHHHGHGRSPGTPACRSCP